MTPSSLERCGRLLSLFARSVFTASLAGEIEMGAGELLRSFALARSIAPGRRLSFQLPLFALNPHQSASVRFMAKSHALSVSDLLRNAAAPIRVNPLVRVVSEGSHARLALPRRISP